MEAFQNSETAFETAYDRYASMLYRLALSRVHHKEDAEDVVHDVFIKYMDYCHKLKDHEHERAWLIRVCINCSTDALRRSNRQQWISFDEIAEVKADEPSSPMLKQILDKNNSLPDKIKTVILLHYLEGYSIKEVASILNISQSACKMRLNRGRKMLKEKIKKEDLYV